MKQIWHLDDTAHWHDISANTVALLDAWELRSLYTGRDLFYALDECQEHASLWPHVILMDFYLQSERGDEVTRAIRNYKSSQRHITIIGFSSVRHCSEQICSAGGDHIIRKTETGDGINKFLLHYLSDYPLT